MNQDQARERRVELEQAGAVRLVSRELHRGTVLREVNLKGGGPLEIVGPLARSFAVIVHAPLADPLEAGGGVALALYAEHEEGLGAEPLALGYVQFSSEPVTLFRVRGLGHRRYTLRASAQKVAARIVVLAQPGDGPPSLVQPADSLDAPTLLWTAPTLPTVEAALDHFGSIARYNATPRTRAEGEPGPLQGNSLGDLKVDGNRDPRSSTAITPNDATVIDCPGGLYVGTGGNIVGRLKDDASDRTWVGVAAGAYVRGWFVAVRATSTTAADIIGYGA